MSEKLSQTGKCLCGKIEISAKTLDPKLGVCHCNMCRKWTAGPFFTVDCGQDVSFSNKDLIQVYNSSEWAERGFCKDCGTNLFYRLKDKNYYMLSVELFDDQSQFVFDHQIFIDEKPKHYEFANSTHKMTGAEVFAKFAG